MAERLIIHGYAFLTRIPFEIRARIERVCSDMYKGFTGAVQEPLPWAKLMIDRFHVAKAHRVCTDTVRKQALRQLKQSLSKADDEDIKGAMLLFRKPPNISKIKSRHCSNSCSCTCPKGLNSGFFEGFNN